MQAIIIVLLLVVLAVLLMVWRYVHSHRRGMNHLQDKTDQVLANQEGGRMQASRQADETRHQNSRVMERMQTLLLWFDKFTKRDDKDKPP